MPAQGCELTFARIHLPARPPFVHLSVIVGLAPDVGQQAVLRKGRQESQHRSAPARVRNSATHLDGKLCAPAGRPAAAAAVLRPAKRLREGGERAPSWTSCGRRAREEGRDPASDGGTRRASVLWETGGRRTRRGGAPPHDGVRRRAARVRHLEPVRALRQPRVAWRRGSKSRTVSRWASEGWGRRGKRRRAHQAAQSRPPGRRRPAQSRPGRRLRRRTWSPSAPRTRTARSRQGRVGRQRRAAGARPKQRQAQARRGERTDRAPELECALLGLVLDRLEHARLGLLVRPNRGRTQVVAERVDDDELGLQSKRGHPWSGLCSGGSGKEGVEGD